jgi:hypothetical protein
MGFFQDVGNFLNKAVNPTSKNFLGLGGTASRAVGAVVSGGVSELYKPDPYGVGRNTAFSKGLGGGVTGSTVGAGTGFLVGGPWGAVAGGVLGGVGGTVAGLKGASNNYTRVGIAKNVGIGVGGGLLGGAGAAIAGSTSVASVPAVTGTTSTTTSTGFFSGFGKGFESLLPLALVSNLAKQGVAQLPALPGGSTGVTLNSAGPGTPTTAPSYGPNLYPGVPQGLQTVGPTYGTAAPAAAAPAKTNWWIWVVVAAAVAYLYLQKKKHGH